MAKNGFTEKSITDSKRLVRGEQWLAIRGFLRARDKVHHAAWIVLIIAGPNPQEEIRCIRAIMPRARIVAVDRAAENVVRALAAGADYGECLDLYEMRESTGGYPRPPSFFDQFGRFDAISLDLTGPANDILRKAINSYWSLVSAQGVMIVTFSFGRDVVEMYHALAARKYDEFSNLAEKTIEACDEVPEQVVIRLYYILRSMMKHLTSIFQYRGPAMPMISFVLWKKTFIKQARYIKIDDLDFELAVTENWSDIYACPIERIIHIRRKFAAQKAVQTRQLRKTITILPQVGEIIPPEDPPLLNYMQTKEG